MKIFLNTQKYAEREKKRMTELIMLKLKQVIIQYPSAKQSQHRKEKKKDTVIDDSTGKCTVHA